MYDKVAPTRVRELKQVIEVDDDLSIMSHPHGCVN